jgi:uncharacterized protein YndB with AHSA1/START domain
LNTDSPTSLSLTARRTIRADAARLFQAWTDPAQLVAWWGPRPVTCAEAQVDLRVGGRYRIGNRMPDGGILYIGGVFEVIQQPRLLVYTWQVEPAAGTPERVTVQFEERGDQTEVTVTHERIPDASMRDRHQAGWQGCFDSLAAYLAR